MDYHELIKKELLFTNRILGFDRRFWDKQSELQIKHCNEKELALKLIQSESHAFLRGVKSSVRESNLRAAGSLLRSILESTANTHWIILDKEGKRAERYIAVTDNFNEYLDLVKASNLKRLPEAIRDWTTSSTEDRINALSPQAGMVWDYCSVFTHPSPTYMSLHPGIDKVLHYVISQANSYALTIRYLMLQETKLFGEKEAKLLDKMAVQLLIDKLPVYPATLS